MSGFMNISDPNSRSDHWETRLRIAKLDAEIEMLRAERDHYRSNLESVFSRIASGDRVYLTYADGTRIDITAVTDEPEQDQ